MPRTLAALVIALILVAPLFPFAAAQTPATSLEKMAAAIGASDVRSIEIAGNGTIFAIGQNATITFDEPGRYRVRASVDVYNLPAVVEAVVPHPVLGDVTVEVRYLDYKEFGGVKFPTKIRQSAGGFPILDLAVTNVQSMREPYVRVTAQMVADGVWSLSGGTHNSALIEMKDHLNKPIRHLVNSRFTTALSGGGRAGRGARRRAC